MQEKKILQKILIAIICGAIFYILGEPCREFFKISETTEIRVTAPLPFLFTVAFGWTGALGCALANTIADLKQNFPLSIAIPGFFCQFLYGILPALAWNWFRRKDHNRFKLDRVYKVVQFLLLAILTSVLVSSGVNILIKFSGFPNSLELWRNIFFNQLTTMIVIGIPFMVFCSLRLQYDLRKKEDLKIHYVFSFSLNEKFLLFFLFASIFIGVSAGGANYQILVYKHQVDPLKLWNYVFYASGIAMNISLWLSLAFLYYMERTVTQPVEQMSEIAKVFGDQTEIDEKITTIVKRCQKYLYFTSEVGDLARSFKTMSNELDTYVKNLTIVAADQQKTHTELSIATAIQTSALPPIEKSDRLDLYAMMDPALEVGGDFYDFFKVDDDHLALLIADVSGKGVPAALFMMVSKIILRHNLRSGLSPAAALAKTNNELSANNPIEMFVSCLCGILDLNTGVLTFSNAGHERPILRRKGGEFVMAKIKSGLVLGGMPGMKYSDFEIQLQPGDVMFTYTDGIPEAMNEMNQQFGNEKMLASLNENCNCPVEELCKNIREAVLKHAGNAPQFDDITMLAFSLKERDRQTKTFEVNKDSLTAVQEFISTWAEEKSVDTKYSNKLAVCTDELVSNVIFYGGATTLEVSCEKREDEILLTFTDNGKAFNPLTQAKEPDITVSVEEREIGGLGIFMVKKLMDVVTYKRVYERNVLSMKLTCI